MEADIGGDGAVAGVQLLVRMHVKQAHRPVGLQATLLTEHQQGAGPAHLQVIRQQESDGLTHQGVGHRVCLQVA